MKTLTIMRHGKNDGCLTPRGIAEIFSLAQITADKYGRPLPKLDAIFHSPTRRTTETASIMAKAGRRSHENTVLAREAMLNSHRVEQIFGGKNLKDEWDHVCFVTHEPEIQIISYHFGFPLNEGFSIQEGSMSIARFKDTVQHWPDLKRVLINPPDYEVIEADPDGLKPEGVETVARQCLGREP